MVKDCIVKNIVIEKPDDDSGAGVFSPAQLEDRHVAQTLGIGNDEVDERMVGPATTETATAGVGAHGVAEHGLGAGAIHDNEETLVHVDVSVCRTGTGGRTGQVLNISFGLGIVNSVSVTILGSSCPECAVAVGKLIEIEVALVGVADQVVAVKTRPCVIGSVVDADGDVTVVERAAVLQQRNPVDGGQVALAGKQCRFVRVCDVLRNIIHVPVAVRVALEIDPVVLRLVEAEKVDLINRNVVGEQAVVIVNIDSKTAGIVVCPTERYLCIGVIAKTCVEIVYGKFPI